MLHLFQSNEMSELARVFCERSSGASDPFKPLTVIVQSFGIGQWLKLETARHQGIAANIDCVLPAAFLWRMYRQHIPETRSIDNSPFPITCPHPATGIFVYFSCQPRLPGCSMST